MRRQYLRNTTAAAAPVMSVESMSIDQLLETRPVLSIEEEVAALQEADALADQATKDVAETTRVEDITDSMLNIADTVGEVKELTPQQAMLVDTASEMAVAGSDGDPDTVIPSAEDMIGKDMTTESFVDSIRDNAQRIWERIRKFCAEIWSTIVQFFQRLFQAAPRQLHHIKKLRELLDVKKKAGGEPKASVITLAVGSNAISYPDYMVKSAKELTKGLGELKSLAAYAYGQYISDCKAMGDKVAAEMKKFDPKKAGDSLHAIATDLPKNNFINMPKAPATGYMGCFDLEVKRVAPGKQKDDLSDAQVVAALRHTGVKISPRAGKAALVVMNNQFQTMTLQECDSVLKETEALIKQLVAYEGSSAAKNLDSVRKALEDAATAAVNAMGKIDNKDEAAKTERMYAMDVLKSMANFNTTLTKWVTDLTMPISKKIYQSTRVSLILVEKSLVAH